jgi:dienelactone hydrolase
VAALEILRNHSSVDPDKTAAIGYCFGGGIVLEMARRGVDLDGVASFHGSLATDTPAQAGQVKPAVFVAHGEADSFVKPETVKAFKAEMETVGVTYQYHGYPGVIHSFTNPDADRLAEKFDLPLAYNKEADEDSWTALQTFLSGIFAD